MPDGQANFHGNQNSGPQIGQFINSTLNFNQLVHGEQEKTQFFRSLASEYQAQKDINPERVNETCEWLLSDDRFWDWRDSKDGCLLHVLAWPGRGKSVLAKAIIDEGLAQNPETTATLYFFFKRGQGEQDRASSAIAAMLHQLYCHDETLISFAMAKFKAFGVKLKDMFQDLWDILLETTASIAGHVVCVLDALDECQDKDQDPFQKALLKLYSNWDKDTSRPRNIKFLITSRPYQEVDLKRRLRTERSDFILFDGEEKSEVIAKEINHAIKVLVPETIPYVSSTTQNSLVNHLMGMDNRTYLWLTLTLDFVKANMDGCGEDESLKKLISQIPPSVDDAYEKLLLRSNQPERTRTLLSIIIAARRPLSIIEAKLAFAYAYGDIESNSCIEEESDDQFRNTVKNLCGLLITFQDSEIFFIHQTARDFLIYRDPAFISSKLIWKGSVLPEHADAVFARACVSYLGKCGIESNSGYWTRGLVFYSPFHPVAYRKYGLLTYCAGFCGQHIKDCQEWLKTSTEASQVLPMRRSLDILLAIPLLSLSVGETDLHLCSTYGFHAWVQWLLSERTDANEEEKDPFPPLSRATVNGHWQTVQILLEHGSNVNQSSAMGTALIQAVFRGYEDIVQLLLDYRADVNVKATCNSSPLRPSYTIGTVLEAATLTGNLDLVRKFVEHGANINEITTSSLRTALHAACHANRNAEQMVYLLLTLGASPDLGAQNGSASPLITASRLGQVEIATQLLQHGADVDFNSVQDGTALMLAVSRGRDRLAEILLQHHADVHVLNETYSTAMECTYLYKDDTHCSRTQILRYHTIGLYGHNHECPDVPLSLMRRNWSCSRGLLESGGNVDSKLKNGDTALLAAARVGRIATIEFTINYWPDPYIVNSDGLTALNIARKLGFRAIVQRLEEYQTRFDARSQI